MNGARNTSGAVYMKRPSRIANTTMIGSPSMRCRTEGRWRAAMAGLDCVTGAASLVLQVDQVLGQLRDRHRPRLDLGDDRAAVHHHQPVGDRVHVGEVVLDIDAG